MEKEHLIKHFLISNLIKKLIMSDIYSDNNKIQKKSHFNLKFEKYKFSKKKLKRAKNSGLRIDIEAPLNKIPSMSRALYLYIEKANNSLINIIQIETKTALENVKEIASIDGVDCLWVGHFDLTNFFQQNII